MISRAAGGVTVHIHFTRCCTCWCWRTDWKCPFSDWSERISERSFDTLCQMHKRRMRVWICSLGWCLDISSPYSLSFLFWPLTKSFLGSGYPPTTFLFFFFSSSLYFTTIAKHSKATNTMMWSTREGGDVIQLHLWQSNAAVDLLQRVFMANVKV